MRTRTIILVIAFTAMTAAVAFAGSDILGRDVAEMGVFEEVSGTLAYEESEWSLKNSFGTYELHLGPIGHEGSLPFADGADATTYGFVLEEHIAPISVTTVDGTYEFWSESRNPGWAGEGERRNAVADRPADAPVARGKSVDNREMTQSFGSGSARQDSDRGYRNQDLRPGRGR